MTRGTTRSRIGIGVLAATLVVGSACSSSGSDSTANSTTTLATTKADVHVQVDPAKVVATLDDRYSSYNVEMVTVTGGSFWAPYDAKTAKQDRPPVDLSSTRLRNLAKALGPAYIRVSGSWTNGTYFDPNATAETKPPEGFNAVLTGKQWKGVGDFAKYVDGEIITSYATDKNVRDANGVWTPDQARARMEFSKANNIPVVAAEYENEPSIPMGKPDGYTAADYVRDFKMFATTARMVMPDMKIVGPSATGDINPTVIPAMLKAKDLLGGGAASMLDVFSYHFYPTKSKRCGGTDAPESVLDPVFLDRVQPVRDFYTKLRDSFTPKAPIWVTEIGEANCGGDPWAKDYADVIRYVDAHGQLAVGDGDVLFHNTLVGSDYAFLSEDGFKTHPIYFAAVLWQRLMGPRVLATQITSGDQDVRVYTQCTPGKSAKGATYAAINISPKATKTIATPSSKSSVYQLTGTSLTAPDVELNGTTLHANTDGTLPAINAKTVNGPVSLPPASVTFITDPTPVPACS